MADEDVEMSWADDLDNGSEGYDDNFDDGFDYPLNEFTDEPKDGVNYEFDDDLDDELGDETDFDLEDNEASGIDQQIPDRSKECSTCFGQRNDLTLIVPCQHEVCTDCQRRAFRLAMHDEERYPPTCCGSGRITIQLAAQVLDAEEFQAYRDRVEELDTKERLYCAVPTCSKFIPPTAIDNEHGACPQCGQRTHTVCRNLEHPGQGCPLDEGVDTVLQMAEEEGWRRCVQCHHLIERTAGCNQMRCRCGQIFCWGCGKRLNECICRAPRLDARGLLQEALDRFRAAAARQLGPRDDNNEDSMHYDRMMEVTGVGDNLMDLVRGFGFDAPPQGGGQGRCADGQHAQWARRVDGHRVCERCREILEHFIMECEACGLRVCANCRQFV